MRDYFITIEGNIYGICNKMLDKDGHLLYEKEIINFEICKKMVKICSSLNWAVDVASKINKDRYGFLCGYEETDGTRKFLVFSSLKEYKDHLDKGQYIHCHEYMTSINYSPIRGRLTFDFDIKMKLSDLDKARFIKDIENSIIYIFNNRYKNVDTKIIEFVWLYTEHNTNKTSYHLKCKNAYFSTDWISQMKTFYMCIKDYLETNKILYYIPISINEIIDEGIATKNHSLRMPFNKKRSGNILKFLDTKYKFEDGLMRIYDSPIDEQTITTNQYINPIETSFKEEKQTEIDDATWKKAFNIVKTKINTSYYSIEDIDGSLMYLKRESPSPCPISGIIHDKQNPFISIFRDKIYFCCRRGCKAPNGKKVLCLGSLLDNTNSDKISTSTTKLSKHIDRVDNTILEMFGLKV